MNLNEEIVVDIIDLDHEGLGIAKIGDFPIFIDNALPGEKILCKITRVTKNIATAKNIKIIKKSNRRNDNICKYYNECGGCNIMHMNYDLQLEFKTNITKRTIYKVSSLSPVINDCIRNDNIYCYRNKIQVPFGIENGNIISGFYRNKTHEIVDLNNCMIEPELSSKIINSFKKLFKKFNISIYNEESHSGIIRHIMIRVSSLNEIMVVIVATKKFDYLDNIIKEINNQFIEIKSIYLNINDKKTNVVLSDKFIHLYKSEYLIENINGLKFVVHPNSFLQINHSQCEKLYKKAIEYANITSEDIVIDAYCGIGSITLNIAKKAKYVYGIEVVKEAVINANMNKDLNNIKNASFICGKCEEEITNLVKNKKIDIIVFDPPRKGCDINFLNTVIKAGIKKIIYISCKTSTFARDVKILCDNGYELKEVTPFDLFSHQAHTECCGILEKRGDTNE